MLSISELERTLEELPLLPTVVVRLLALDVNDDEFFEKVLKLSEDDPTFAMRVIKLSNSASSSPISSISTLQDAVVRLGPKAIAGLITSMAVMRVFLPTTQGEKNLWIHSIQTAVAARAIAKLTPTLKANPEQAYLCGLLHDIGRFVIFDKSSGDLNIVEESNWESPKQLVDTETDIYGFNHAQLGEKVCKKWRLPDIVTRVVKNHHVYDLGDRPSSELKANNLTLIVQLADFFSVFMMLSPNSLESDKETLLKDLHNKCISPSSSKPPITAKQLLDIAPKALLEAEKIASDLGVGRSV